MTDESMAEPTPHLITRAEVSGFSPVKSPPTSSPIYSSLFLSLYAVIDIHFYDL